jgi:hypothetical protein
MFLLMYRISTKKRNDMSVKQGNWLGVETSDRERTKRQDEMGVSINKVLHMHA